MVEPVSELGQVASRYTGIQVVFGVEEHVVGNQRFEPAANSSSDEVRTVAVVVNRPYRKEGGEALADAHDNYMVEEEPEVEPQNDGSHPAGGGA